MSSAHDQKGHGDPQLRADAEARLAHTSKGKRPTRPTEELLHELQVHQIELEMQNESLRQFQIALEESRDRYVDLYDFAPVGYLTLAREGMISEINLTGAALLGEERKKLLKRRFSSFVAAADRDHWHRLFMTVIQSDERQSKELALQRNNDVVFHARLDCLRITSDRSPPVVRVALTDITESRKAAETSAAALRAMAENLEAQVLGRTAQLRALTAELTMTEERERRSLAEDLHDNLGQLLAAVKIKLASLEPASLQSSVREIEGLVDEADQSVRMLTLKLNPPVLHTLGLKPALGWLVEEMARLYGLTVRINDDDETPLLDETTRAIMFRSVRELLINVAKHAKVNVADVTCLVHDGRLTVAVSDAGGGFDASKILAALPGASGFGLFSVRERIAFIGGQMDIDSAVGDGTTITLTAPAANGDRRP